MYVLSTPVAKVGFILPPKTGTRSTERALREVGAVSHAGRHGVSRPHLDECDALVSNVRNPFDVLVSWYHYQEFRAKPPKTNKTFDEWFDSAVRKGKNSYLGVSTLKHAENASKFLRYEQGLESQVREYLFGLGFFLKEFPHIGAAKERTDYRGYYSTKLRDEVLERYRNDFERFGYDW